MHLRYYKNVFRPELPEKVRGLYHAGSVGIIMSGWLGTINYGVIAANKMALALA